ncbi:DUF1405 domain-containing protein [Paenibacillus rhizoplanae]
MNLLGTVYGYMWYGNQLTFTAQTEPLWLLPFVPDSPTASLFFTAALLLLLYPPRGLTGTLVRELIEALAVLTSVKYGIWAVSIIVAGGYQGGFDHLEGLDADDLPYRNGCRSPDLCPLLHLPEDAASGACVDVR